MSAPAPIDERVLAPLGRRRVEVVRRTALGAYFVLTLADPVGPVPQAGQFYMLAAAERWGGGEDERPFLPRAFSVARAHADATLDFVVEDVGPGTNRLGELDSGDEAWLLGPLGIGFRPPRQGRRPILCGGGIGIAPLIIWHDAKPGTEPFLALLGFRSAAHAEAASLLPGALVATDDGSVGHHGLVTDLLSEELARKGSVPGFAVEVYACGPPPMLEAVRALCADAEVPAQLAMESGMACGFGACFGCVVPTHTGYVRLCVDGPVLDAADLEVVE